MSVHAFSSYSTEAGSTRVRLTDWFRHLALTLEVHNYIGRKDARGATLARHLPEVIRAERDLRRVDVREATVLMSREASPLSAGTIEVRILRDAAHSVYDFDDAIFEDPSPVRRMLGQDGKCRNLVAAADVVIAGNDYLAQWASKTVSNVVMIPSCVEPGDYQPKTSWETSEIPIIVWLGSPSTEQYVAEVAGSLRRVHERTGARLRLVSGPHDNPALAPLADMMERIPWSAASYASALQGADVAIGPLSDTPFARGKCAYKLLQYAASALPIVASPVGANEVALQRFDGLAAHGAWDWVDALTQVLTEPASLRRRRGLVGLEAARRHYSFAAWEQQWRAATGLVA